MGRSAKHSAFLDGLVAKLKGKAEECQARILMFKERAEVCKRHGLLEYAAEDAELTAIHSGRWQVFIMIVEELEAELGKPEEPANE